MKNHLFYRYRIEMKIFPLNAVFCFKMQVIPEIKKSEVNRNLSLEALDEMSEDQLIAYSQQMLVEFKRLEALRVTNDINSRIANSADELDGATAVAINLINETPNLLSAIEHPKEWAIVGKETIAKGDDKLDSIDYSFVDIQLHNKLMADLEKNRADAQEAADKRQAELVKSVPTTSLEAVKVCFENYADADFGDKLSHCQKDICQGDSHCFAEVEEFAWELN